MMSAEVAELGNRTSACSRCKTRERAPHQRYCRYCHAEYMRERRALRRSDQRQFHLAYGHFEQALRAIASGDVVDARAAAREALSSARPQ